MKCYKFVVKCFLSRMIDKFRWRSRHAGRDENVILLGPLGACRWRVYLRPAAPPHLCGEYLWTDLPAAGTVEGLPSSQFQRLNFRRLGHFLDGVDT